MKLFVDFWKFTKIWKGLWHRNTELFLFWLLDVQNNFMFPTCKNSQKRVENQKSTDKYLSFDGLIQEDIDLSDIYLAVRKSMSNIICLAKFKLLIFIWFWRTFHLCISDNQSSMSLDQDEQNAADTVADHFMEDNWPPQNIPLTVTDKSNKKKPGIIFLSSIPPGFNVTTTIAFFSQFGKVGRVFLQPGKVLWRKFWKKSKM